MVVANEIRKLAEYMIEKKDTISDAFELKLHNDKKENKEEKVIY